MYCRPNAGTRDIGTINSNDRIAWTLYSLGERVCLGKICINTLHKGDNDDDNNKNNNNDMENNIRCPMYCGIAQVQFWTWECATVDNSINSEHRMFRQEMCPSYSCWMTIIETCFEIKVNCLVNSFNGKFTTEIGIQKSFLIGMWTLAYYTISGHKYHRSSG